MSQLIHYESACREIALAATVDEAKDWADKSAALRAYARQAHNTELEVQVAEIRLRALRRLGELSAVLEKAAGALNSSRDREELKPKAATLHQAGLSTSTAHRCEQLAAVPAPAFEGYLAEKRDAMEPASASEVMARARMPRAVYASSATPEHYTPRRILDAVMACMGAIDLDPCSNGHDAPNVPAAQHFTRDDDGLSQPWRGQVFMNPPYGDVIGEWTRKLADEYAARRVTQAIALLPAKTDTAWWRALVMDTRYYALFCTLFGRLKFGDAANSAPFPSAVVYLGERPHQFYDVFGPLGIVCVPVYSDDFPGILWGERRV